MANYKEHAAGGIVAGALVVSALNVFDLNFLPSREAVLSDWQVSVTLIAVSVLFALWPDVDTNSKAQNLFYGVGFIINIFLIVSGFFVLSAILGLLAMTPIVGKHRGWTHSKLAAVLIPAPLVIIPYLANEGIGPTSLLIYIVAVSGYFSHLLLDGLIWRRIRVRSRWR